jgi:hypothetical protein
MYSMMGKQNSTWGVAFNSSNEIVLFKGSSYASRTPVFDEKFKVNSPVSVTGLNEVIFSRITGTPSATLTISVTANTDTETIIVNSQGVVNRP